MTKEGKDKVKESLSEKIKEKVWIHKHKKEFIRTYVDFILKEDVKEKIENAQKRLKEIYCEDWIEGRCNFIKGCSECNKIDKVFKEEFGGKFI